MKISEFQRLMKDLYLAKDKQRGLDKTFLWLISEIGELSEALRKNKREKIEEEMADCIAWLCSLANILDINLQQAALRKYPLQCSKCHKNPCVCTED
ncbi:MAG: MazG nucleotide pyrophosphohydrolase domain-containing protein [Candidatus Hermodarchaeota archaeon]